jgi:plasmid stabilization system protein ParE
MARITRRPLAAADILDIWHHIAEDSVERADRWVDKLDEKFRLIATQPLTGRARAELAANVRSSRADATSSSTNQSKTGSTWCACCTALATSTRSSARTRRQRRPRAC